MLGFANVLLAEEWAGFHLSAPLPDPERLVRNHFSIRQSFVLPDGGLEYQVVYDRTSKRQFVDLASELSQSGYRPELTGTTDEAVLTLRKVDGTPERLSRLPVLLALFTFVTLVVFALLQQLVYEQLIPTLPGYFVFFEIGATIAVLLGAHELGQRLAARSRGGGHASSYLIPGIPFLPPFLPSMGFVASQRRPALNRDRLFDTVIAGPLAILALALLAYAIGDLTAVQSSVVYQGSHLANTTVSVNSNAIQMGVDSILGPFLPQVATGYVLVSPIADGATVGFIIVFLGLLPMVSYDGGILSAIAWGTRTSRVLSYLSVFALLVLDTPTYWAIAVVVLLLAGRPFQLKLMDDVSELSQWRQWAFVGSLVLAFLCLPVPHNIGTLPLP